MKRDRLYLIRQNFPDQGQTFYCPGCAEMIGLLEFYPALKSGMEIHYVDFARPRPELVSLLGESNQSCPVLVLGTVRQNFPAHLQVQEANGQAFVAGTREIGEFLAHVHGIGRPY